MSIVGGLGGLGFFSDDAESEGLDFAASLVLGGAVDHDAGEGGDFGDPAAVVFLFEVDCEVHGWSDFMRGGLLRLIYFL